MSDAPRDAFPKQLLLLEYLKNRGWRPVRDEGREEVAGLCPLHRETRPSFYVNRRKQVFYCHGCGRGGGLARLRQLLDDDVPAPAALECAYQFYAQQRTRYPEAQAYLARRGLHDAAVIERLRIGYAPGACLRAHLARLGCGRQAVLESGLVDARGFDVFFRCLTFPLPESGNLYGRSITESPVRHRFLARSKGGLYGWAQARGLARLILVEGLFDLASLWQAGFPQTVAALGAHLNRRQWAQLSQAHGRRVYVCFDADPSGHGAARGLSAALGQAGVEALRVALPEGHDPSSFFAARAQAGDFQRCLDRAWP